MAEAAAVRLDATVSGTEIGQRSGVWFYFFAGIVLAVVTLTAFQAGMWFEPLPSSSTVLILRASMDGFYVDGYVLTADVSSYSDELFAYLMFDYLRTRRATDGMSYLLIFDPKNAEKPYRVRVRAEGDYVAGMAAMMDLQTSGLVKATSVGLRPASDVSGFKQQTRLFVSAYNLPIRKKLEQASRKALSELSGAFHPFQVDHRPSHPIGPSTGADGSIAS